MWRYDDHNYSMLKSVESNNLPFEDFCTIMDTVVYDFDKAENTKRGGRYRKRYSSRKTQKRTGTTLSYRHYIRRINLTSTGGTKSVRYSKLNKSDANYELDFVKL